MKDCCICAVGFLVFTQMSTSFARFVCQLAITEVQQADVMSDMVMTSHARINDQRIGFGVGLSTTENIEYIHNLREKYPENKSLDPTFDVVDTGECV